MHNTPDTPFIWRAAMALALLLSVACGGGDGGSGTTSDPDAGTTTGADTGAEDTGTTTADTDDSDTSEGPTADQELLLAVTETGSWEIPGLEQEVQVVYTEMGVPHIYANSRQDMGYALGFLLARDRFFVMDLQRRLALGNLAEILGDIALPNDIEARLMGMSEVTDLILDNLSEEDAAYMDAYAAGVNTYIDLVSAGELPAPSELVTAGPLLGSADPTTFMLPFDRRSVAAMVAVIVYETNFDTGDPGAERKAEQAEQVFPDDDAPFVGLRRAGARQDIYDRAVPLFDVVSTPGFGIYEDGQLADSKPRTQRHPVQADPEAVRAAVSANKAMMSRTIERLDVMNKRLGRKELENFGSNAWAVHGSRTSDGASLVAGDGHLPLSVPSLMYQIGMDTTVFGGGDIAEAGLLITSLPVLAVGTNGRVAWSQVNPVADITDWYREELILNDDGVPVATMFRGEEQPLTAVEEEYAVADIPALGSEGRTETWTRWTTFDGRHIFDIEGVEVDIDDPIEPGQTRVRIGDDIIVPQDTDDDGIISAVSFDYTAFDITSYVGTLADFTKADTVYDYQEATKGLIGNMLTATVSDDQGNILFTPYQAVPCRGYLPRDGNGRWMRGADPTQLIDGTTYGGFTIPSLPDGKVDESQGADDPYKCVVPFNATPQSINPPEGFVFNANNQPAPIHNDGTLDDDPWYIGGPWSSVRADSIARELTREVEDNGADIAAMSRLHAYRNSRLGEEFVPWLEGAITQASALNSVDRVLEPHEQRLVDLYNTNQARFDEAIGRLGTWRERGYDTPSGVVTFYTPTVTEDERADSVATMIFNAWMPRFMNAVFSDEGMDPAFRFSGSRMRASSLKWFLSNRGDMDAGIASHNPETGESVFFDILATEEVERSDEIMLTALADALDWLADEPQGPGAGGFGTDDMDQWIWGLRHQVRFESLLADFLPSDSDFGFLTDLFSITTTTLPLEGEAESNGLKWFPRGGDNWAVDAASPGFSGTRFTYGSGPVMRMVIALKPGEVSGVNIVPGGRSGLTESPYFADQAALWLANDTVPIRYTPTQVAEGATGREVLKPAQ